MKKIFICCFALVATTNYLQGMIPQNRSTLGGAGNPRQATVRDRSDMEDETEEIPYKKLCQRPRSASDSIAYLPITTDLPGDLSKSGPTSDPITPLETDTKNITRGMAELNLDSNKNNEQTTPNPKN